MRTKPALALISIAAVALGACTSGASPSAPTAAPAASQIAVATLTASAVPVDSTSPTASSSNEPAASSGGGGAQPTPGSLDPCSLLTADEASTAMGRKLGAGVSAELHPDRICTFKGGLSEVKVILAPPAPDAATAKAYWDAARTQVPAGIPIKDLSVFDRSAFGAGSAGGMSLSALFVIDGTTFFDFFCELPGCSEDASVAAAQLIAGRLP
jgi:hypothetical protein